MNNAFCMRRCLKLAEKGRGCVGNGALVGAILVREGKIIAEGAHRGFGSPHAERDLLETFTGSIEPTDTLSVNLEPCCHTGKTPPCTDIILERGVKRLVYGLCDPDARVSGKGLQLLRSHGVEVIGPVLHDECAWFNRGFLSVREKNRPWITLKSAVAADGSIAHPDGSPKRITSKEQDAWSHQFLRARHDAILVGVQTIINDNPSLTVRSLDVPVQPWRMIFDPSLRTSLDCHLLNDENRGRTILVTSNDHSAQEIDVFQKKGCVVWQINCINNVFDLQAFFQGCTSTSENFHGITSILVEGGRRTWNEFYCHRTVDAVVSFQGT